MPEKVGSSMLIYPGADSWHPEGHSADPDAFQQIGT
jgi:hypothetical protein